MTLFENPSAPLVKNSWNGSTKPNYEKITFGLWSGHYRAHVVKISAKSKISIITSVGLPVSQKLTLKVIFVRYLPGVCDTDFFNSIPIPILFSWSINISMLFDTDTTFDTDTAFVTTKYLGSHSDKIALALFIDQHSASLTYFSSLRCMKINELLICNKTSVRCDDNIFSRDTIAVSIPINTIDFRYQVF